VKAIKDVTEGCDARPEALRSWLNGFREANGDAKTNLVIRDRVSLKELGQDGQSMRLKHFLRIAAACGLDPGEWTRVKRRVEPLRTVASTVSPSPQV